MDITNHTHHNRHITFVQGLVKQQAFSEIRQALATAPQADVRQLWIDCSHVDRTQLTTSNLCLFVGELLKFKNEQVQVVLCGMDQTTEKLFILLKLDMLFGKARSLQDALVPDKQLVAA
ncbi:STAS domain-containing protein [Pontibacter roseus]|uniref:STAS domain-containing protein n=1 Tax=Pontibacter roseus TaxID=336989 RepID=UPI0003637F66|nr:STAS domain-containing protein [Pontibacter roseus]